MTFFLLEPFLRNSKLKQMNRIRIRDGNSRVKHKKINGHLNIKFMVDNSRNTSIYVYIGL